MIEKPNISDEKIITALNANYPIQAGKIDFLPIGNDAAAFAYRVESRNGDLYFLKLKKKQSNLAGLFAPRYLKDHGIEQVIAPLPTRAQELFQEMDGFRLILYPFIAGKEGVEVGMSDSQWNEFGSLLKRIHITRLPSDFSQYVSRETFIPKSSNLAKELNKSINTQGFIDPYQRELAAFWKDNHATIQTIIDRAERIGKRLQKTNLEFVLCHADIHTANILITPQQTMFIVDWDGALFAPKERDLMFVAGRKEDDLFFKGYGSVQIDRLALAYYRYEWCVQEIGDYGERVFLTKDTGASTKQSAVKEFIRLFSHGDVIEAALNTQVEI